MLNLECVKLNSQFWAIAKYQFNLKLILAIVLSFMPDIYYFL